MSTFFRRTPGKLALVALAAAASTLALPASHAQAVGGRTFYISPAGSDSNAGTDAAHPFRTLEHVSNGFLQAGDTVLLQDGGTFSGQLGVWSSGTASQRITVSDYGTGAKPVVTGSCVQVGGDYITVQNLLVTNCSGDNGIWVYGANDVVQNNETTHNVQSIAVDAHATGTKILRNNVHDNDRMAPNTPGPTDDYGAIGIVVDGTNTEVAYNTISNNHAPSADFGTDGSAVEIYGGVNTSVHHNVASNNETFTELGNSHSANTVFAYNQVTSNLPDSEFLITRGAQDYFGPVAGTVAVNNTVVLTGAQSRGYVCYAGCTPALFTLYNNVLDVSGQIGYLQGTMAGGNNLYWHGSMGSAPMLAGDRFTNPKFRGGGLIPTPKSPAVDTGRTTPVKVALDGVKVGVDGNGDGKGGTDIGAYEVKAPHHGHHHHGHHHGNHHQGHHHHGSHHHQGHHRHHHHRHHRHHGQHQHGRLS